MLSRNIEKIRACKAAAWKQRSRKPLKKTPLKKISRSQRTKLKAYYEIRNQYLRLPENKWCLICACVSLQKPLEQVKVLAKKDILWEQPGIKLTTSSEVHHVKLRGKNLCNTETFCPSCRSCREYPHEHASKARILGLLQ